MENIVTFVQTCKAKFLHISDNSILKDYTEVACFAMTYVYSNIPKVSFFSLSLFYQNREFIICNGTDETFLVDLNRKTVPIRGLYIFNYQLQKDDNALEMLSNVIMNQRSLAQLYIWNCGMNKFNAQVIISLMLDENCNKTLSVYEKSLTDFTNVLTSELFQVTIFTLVLLSANSLVLQNAVDEQVKFILLLHVAVPEYDQINDICISNSYFNNNNIKLLTKLCS